MHIEDAERDLLRPFCWKRLRLRVREESLVRAEEIEAAVCCSLAVILEAEESVPYELKRVLLRLFREENSNSTEFEAVVD